MFCPWYQLPKSNLLNLLRRVTSRIRAHFFISIDFLSLRSTLSTLMPKFGCSVVRPATLFASFPVVSN